VLIKKYWHIKETAKILNDNIQKSAYVKNKMAIKATIDEYIGASKNNGLCILANS
jgi:preprotein translocase subunit Sss1